MLLLLQAAAQQLSPINATVQLPPGPPDWKRTLITIGVGALLGNAAGIALKFLTRLIADRRLLKTVGEELGDELVHNLRITENGAKIFANAHQLLNEDAKGKALLYAKRATALLRFDRFDFYFSNHKRVVNQHDSAELLRSFNEVTREWLPRETKEEDCEAIAGSFRCATALGYDYVERHKFKYVPEPHDVERILAGIDER